MIERIDIPIKTKIFEDAIGLLEGYEGKSGQSVTLHAIYKESGNTYRLNFPKDAIPAVIKWLEEQKKVE